MNRFAFLAAGVATAAIALMAVAGGGLLDPSPPTIASQPPQSSPGPSPVASPSPSPSLAHNGVIAVVRSGAVVLVDPITGETVRTLVNAPGSDTDPYAATDLSWSPDGRSLAYVSREGPIFVIDVTTGTSKQIFGCGREIAACAIAWSPDGRNIAVTHSGELELIDPSGDHQQTLYRFSSGSVIQHTVVTQPTWSPDGLRIAVVVMEVIRQDVVPSLFVIGRDGSDLTSLLGPMPGLGLSDPAWSPDGQSIGYLGSTDHRTCPTTSGQGCQHDQQLYLMVLDLDGSAPRQLSEAGVCFCAGFMPGMTWSPDGTRVALVIPAVGRDWGLEIVNADGTGKRPVAEGAWGPVAWQPVP